MLVFPAHGPVVAGLPQNKESTHIRLIFFLTQKGSSQGPPPNFGVPKIGSARVSRFRVVARFPQEASQQVAHSAQQVAAGLHRGSGATRVPMSTWGFGSC